MFHRSRTLAAITAIAGTALALTACSSSGGGAPAELDPDEEITIDFAYWGNDVRAELYDEAIAAFNEEYPNITVRSSFLAWTEYWDKRRTEAAGGGLPDVIQMDMNYLREYSEAGLLLDLAPYMGEQINTDGLDAAVLANGEIGGQTTAVPVSTNALGMFFNPTLAEELGVEGFAGGTWEEYDAWLADVKDTFDADGVQAWGGSKYTSMQAFEIQQRAKGEDLFTDDGEVNFTREDLADYWNQTQPLIADDLVTPQQRIEELSPLTAFDAAEQLTEITWDTMGVGFLANLGEAYPTLEIQAPPVTVEGAQDLYRKAGMLLSGAGTSDHPEAVAAFIDFMVNDPQTGAIFGTNRGIPASQTALDGATLEGINAQVIEYEESVADRLGDAPPVPVVGYGPIEQLFTQLGSELGFGTITVDEAVDQMFNEMDILLG